MSTLGGGREKENLCLKGKVAVVTGGYGHLGRAIAEVLCAKGAKTIVAGREESKFQDVFGEEAVGISFEHLDISSTDSVKDCFSSVYQKHKQIDILVNNAFYSDGNNPEDMTDDQWQKGVDGTLNSVFKCIRDVVGYMKQSHGGNIINIASMYGMTSPDFEIYDKFPEFLNPTNYGASKAGIIQLTKYYAKYFAKDKIRVNAISPGAFPSNKVQERKGFIKNLEGKIPLGRIGRPEDLKGTVIFLASDRSSYVTGQNIAVDGGWTMQGVD